MGASLAPSGTTMTVLSLVPSRIGTMTTRLSKSVASAGALKLGVRSSAGSFVCGFASWFACWAKPFATETITSATKQEKPLSLFMLFYFASYATNRDEPALDGYSQFDSNSKVPVIELEEVLDPLAGTFEDLAGVYCCTNADILACRCCTFPNGSGGVDRMQSNQVSRALPGACSKVACALCCTFSDVAASTPNISTRAPALFLDRELACRVIWSR